MSRPMMQRLAIVVAAGLLASCTAMQPGGAIGWTLPPTNGQFDYQLGGAYEPAEGVVVVVRDSTAAPAFGLYSICYINGFQTQPGEFERWQFEHPDAVLRGPDGQPMTDPDWPDEAALDTRTEASRAQIVAALTPVIEGCASAGFRAVEFDNLDSWTRFDGLTMEGNLALASALVIVAHEHGLAAAQKNAVELEAQGPATGFDFVISEECARWNECAGYAEQYGELHLDIEYDDDLPEGLGFAEVCELPDQPPMAILRDRQLTTPESPDHRFEACPR